MILEQTNLSNLPMLQGPAGLAYTALQVMTIVSSYGSEKKQAMPYSKFAQTTDEQKNKKKDDDAKEASTTEEETTSTGIQVSSRIGMLVIYSPALLASMFVLFVQSNITLAGMMTFVHFLKRDLEVLFLHKYSGSTPLSTASLIGTFYAANAFMTCAVSTTTPSYLAAQVGTLLFVIGIVGNFYHHYLLATLRSNRGNTSSATKKYFAPKGGLFGYVAAPHYFFELVGWLGVAIASQHVNVYLAFGGMASYLSARAERQNDWNRNKFTSSEWPESRKNLVPFLF